MKKAFIIFSGYNQRAVIAFIRTLENSDIQYGIIANSKNDPILLTEYRNKVLVVRNSQRLVWVEILKYIEIVQENMGAKRYVIAPSTESLNRFLLANREKFRKYHCEIPLVVKELYERISDKYEFQKICNDNGILTPKELERLDLVSFPYVAKPKKYMSDNGDIYSPELIFDRKDHLSFIGTKKVGDFYYQEFIRGRSLYLLYYFYKDGTVEKFSQENYIQQSNGCSIIAAVSSGFHLKEESLKYEELFRSLNFFGLVMVEVKQYKNKSFMIEANPRFWGPSQLFMDAGINLFQGLLYDMGMVGKKPSFKKQTKTTRYFWFGGMLKTLFEKEEMSYHGYSPEKYMKSLPDWISADIYRRKDTYKIFRGETRV